MEPKHMPLISFPWLFEKDLGRIATGIDTLDELEELGLTTLTFPKESGHSRKRQGGGEANMEDFIQQEDGVIVHRGEELDLFRHVESDNLSESDYEEMRSATEDHSFMIGESGEAVLATEFQLPKVPIPTRLLSGTGVEDVVPRRELDGLVGPLKAARRAYESGELPYLNTNGLGEAQASVQYSEEGPSHNTSFQNGPIDDLFITPTSPVNANDSRPLPLPSIATMTLANSTPIPSGEFQADSMEEEEVDVIANESALKKLARMLGDDDSATKDLSDPEEVVDEDEVVEVEAKESSLERLAALLDS
jgi:RNA-dependent RNA polymerase